MSKKDKKPPDNTKSEREDAFDEADDYLFQDDPEEEDVFSDRKYWEKYFEEEDEEMFQRRQRRIKVKSKFKDFDRE